MTEMYGTRWTSSFGDKVEPEGVWARVLAGITGEQLANGLNQIVLHGEAWPPSAPEFRSMCLNLSPKAFGLPDYPVAFSQALSGRITSRAIKVACHDLEFELRRGTTENKGLRDKFYYQYSIVVQRMAEGKPIDGPFNKALGYGGKFSVEQILEQSKKEIDMQVEAMGITKDNARSLLKKIMRKGHGSATNA